MTCPICGTENVAAELAGHLPHFYRCPACTGYFPERGAAPPAYAETYFAEPAKPSAFGASLLKIVNVLRLGQKRKIWALLRGKDGRVLDYGCGKGAFVAFLLRAGFRAEGYDPSPSAVALAQKAGLPVFNMIPNKQYDAMTFWHCLEHTDEPLRDLRLVRAHLNPGARLLVAVPNGDSLEARFGDYWFCYDWPFHRIHFTAESLRVMLERAGFRVLTIDHFNPAYTVSSLAQTFLNLFLPKNALYALVANRRAEHGRIATVFWGLLSIGLLIFFSPLLLLVYVWELATRRTAAMIVTAEMM